MCAGQWNICIKCIQQATKSTKIDQKSTQNQSKIDPNLVQRGSMGVHGPHRPSGLILAPFLLGPSWGHLAAMLTKKLIFRGFRRPSKTNMISNTIWNPLGADFGASDQDANVKIFKRHRRVMFLTIWGSRTSIQNIKKQWRCIKKQMPNITKQYLRISCLCPTQQTKLSVHSATHPKS